MSIILLYVTTKDKPEALAITRTLLDEKLIACANILDGMTSVYRWEGAVQTETETVLILKTRADLGAQVSDRVKALHSYTTPCILQLSVEAGNADFLDWIASETVAS